MSECVCVKITWNSMSMLVSSLKSQHTTYNKRTHIINKKAQNSNKTHTIHQIGSNWTHSTSNDIYNMESVQILMTDAATDQFHVIFPICLISILLLPSASKTIYNQWHVYTLTQAHKHTRIQKNILEKKNEKNLKSRRTLSNFHHSSQHE